MTKSSTTTWFCRLAIAASLTLAASQSFAQQPDVGDQPGLVADDTYELDPQFKRSARLMLRLSSLTLPHALARVLLAEQVYRAWSVLAGHPYHRA